MADYLKILFLPFLASAVASFLTTPVVTKLAWKLGIVDDPAKHKHPKVIHTKPTPRGGGLAIYLSILISSLIFLPLDKHLMGILTGMTLILVMGLYDDYLLS